VAYREWEPPAALRDSVACLWSHRVGPDPNPVLPDGCSDLVWVAGRGAHVAGPDTGPSVVAVEPGTLIVGLRFRPGAGGAALGLPLDEVRDQRLELPGLDVAGDLSPAAAAEALTRHAADGLDRTAPDPVVQQAIDLLADPAIDLTRVRREVEVSERQLRRRFGAAVGYGPKTLQRVLRFRRFLDGLDDETDLADAAARTGFADQPHLNRECRDLAGMTPAQLAASWT
jgi:AraC-like DNA-binding protein